MEKKIIDFTLEQKLKHQELDTVNELRQVILSIVRKYGDISDATKEKYNADPDAEYRIVISISTIRNYLKPYGYVIKKDVREPVVREIGYPEYAEIRKKIDVLNNKDAAIKKNKVSVAETLMLDYVKKAEEYREQMQVSVRLAVPVQKKLNSLYAKFSMLSKMYLLNYLIDNAIDNLEA